MPRMPRVIMKGVLYYITSKSGHEQDLFVDPADYIQYISFLANYKKQYGFKLFAYVLMPKHLHLLIEPKADTSISNIMHDISSLYTKSYNNRYNQKGHLFQERFKAVIAEKEPYLLPLTRHIHVHPMSAKKVKDPKDYPYSSHVKFLDPAKRQHPDMGAEIEEIFGALGGREEVFEKYVINADPKEISDFKKLIRKNRILGSKKFMDEVKKAIEESVKLQKRQPAVYKRQLVYVLTGGMAIIILVVTIANYYRQQNIALMTTYDKTLQLYDSTLEMLKRQREDAVKANKDIEEYTWKIELVENALDKLQKEKEEAAREEKELGGYSWDISLTQTSGPAMDFSDRDTISFTGARVKSLKMGEEGFAGSNYSKRESNDGSITWDAMEMSNRGETAGWHGKWDGRVMRGVLSRRLPNGIARDFSFVSVGERRKEGKK